MPDHVEVTSDAFGETLAELISQHEATIGIIGLGYVGLPLAVRFAEEGFRTLGFDVSDDTVTLLNNGSSHIQDVSAQSIKNVSDAKRFFATTDMALLAEADVITICVPTPLSKTRDPDISYVAAAVEQIAKTLRHGQLIILESTTYPGTTREILLSTFSGSGLEVGSDYFLAYSPERIDPGNPTYNIFNTPKVVGGINNVSTSLAVAFYEQIVEQVVAVSSPDAAEMVKLLENTFRSVNIALANETALMCDLLGIDVWEVIDAAATKPFGFMPFYPGPGIGGHCIPLDPFYLSWKMKTLNYRARFIELAGEINSSMPMYVIDKIVEGLNEDSKSVRNSTILLLGVAYKANIDDVRESPALDLIALLEARGGNVQYHDPHVPLVLVDDIELRSLELTPEVLVAADCVVIVTNHESVDLQMVANHARLVVDARHAMKSIVGPARVVGL